MSNLSSGAKFICLMTICIITPSFFKLSIVVYVRCNVDRLKILREALPLVGHFSEIWLKIGKIKF